MRLIPTADALAWLLSLPRTPNNIIASRVLQLYPGLHADREELANRVVEQNRRIAALEAGLNGLLALCDTWSQNGALNRAAECWEHYRAILFGSKP